MNCVIFAANKRHYYDSFPFCKFSSSIRDRHLSCLIIILKNGLNLNSNDRICHLKRDFSRFVLIRSMKAHINGRKVLLLLLYIFLSIMIPLHPVNFLNLILTFWKEPFIQF